jgi:hypothetical protein
MESQTIPHNAAQGRDDTLKVASKDGQSNSKLNNAAQAYWSPRMDYKMTPAKPRAG